MRSKLVAAAVVATTAASVLSGAAARKVPVTEHVADRHDPFSGKLLAHVYKVTDVPLAEKFERAAEKSATTTTRVIDGVKVSLPKVNLETDVDANTKLMLKTLGKFQFERASS